MAERTPAAIRADLDSAEKALDVLIRQVTVRNLRPDRSWRGATTSMQDRVAKLRDELEAASGRL